MKENTRYTIWIRNRNEYLHFNNVKEAFGTFHKLARLGEYVALNDRNMKNLFLRCRMVANNEYTQGTIRYYNIK